MWDLETDSNCWNDDIIFTVDKDIPKHSTAVREKEISWRTGTRHQCCRIEVKYTQRHFCTPIIYQQQQLMLPNHSKMLCDLIEDISWRTCTNHQCCRITVKYTHRHFCTTIIFQQQQLMLTNQSQMLCDYTESIAVSVCNYCLCCSVEHICEGISFRAILAHDYLQYT